MHQAIKAIFTRMDRMIETTPVTKQRELDNWILLANSRIRELLGKREGLEHWEVLGASTALHLAYERRFGRWQIEPTPNPHRGRLDYLVACEYTCGTVGGMATSHLLIVKDCPGTNEAQLCAMAYLEWSNRDVPEYWDFFSVSIVLGGADLTYIYPSGTDHTPITILNATDGVTHVHH